MSKARQLADLLDSGGDVVSGALDNVPSNAADWNTTTNKPSYLSVDTTNAGNITQGYLPMSRLAGSPSSSKYLRGDNQWVTNCTNHANCATTNCACACACNC